MQRWEFTWKAVGYGDTREEALRDARSYVDSAEPCDEVLLTEEEDDE
jgi:hypothetical protein